MSTPPNGAHLFVIISNPDDEEKVLIVNICSYDDPITQDASCILEAKCHSSIKRKSYIEYAFAEALSFEQIEKIKKIEPYHTTEPVSQQILKSIQDGAKNPEGALPKKFRHHFKYF